MFRRKDEDREILEKKAIELCLVMESETRICRELVNLSETEQKHLMKNKVEKLVDNTRRMKETVKELKRLQRIRNKFMMEMGNRLDMDTDDITLANIIRRLKPELRDKLIRTREELVETGDRLLEVNHNTVYLINFSLDLLEQQSNLWKELATEKNDEYSPQQNEEETRSVAVEEKA
jgi:hypothetical protein